MIGEQSRILPIKNKTGHDIQIVKHLKFNSHIKISKIK